MDYITVQEREVNGSKPASIATMGLKFNMLIVVSVLLLSAQWSAADEAADKQALATKSTELNVILKNILAFIPDLIKLFKELLDILANLLAILLATGAKDIKVIVALLNDIKNYLLQSNDIIVKLLVLVLNVLNVLLNPIILLSNVLILLPPLKPIIQVLLAALLLLQKYLKTVLPLEDIVKKALELVSNLLLQLVDVTVLTPALLAILETGVKAIITIVNQLLDISNDFYNVLVVIIADIAKSILDLA